MIKKCIWYLEERPQCYHQLTQWPLDNDSHSHNLLGPGAGDTKKEVDALPSQAERPDQQASSSYKDLLPHVADGLD